MGKNLGSPDRSMGESHWVLRGFIFLWVVTQITPWALLRGKFSDYLCPLVAWTKEILWLNMNNTCCPVRKSKDESLGSLLLRPPSWNVVLAILTWKRGGQIKLRDNSVPFPHPHPNIDSYPDQFLSICGGHKPGTYIFFSPVQSLISHLGPSYLSPQSF